MLPDDEFARAKIVDAAVRAVQRHQPIPRPYITVVIETLLSNPEILQPLLDEIAAHVVDANEGLGEALCAVNEALGLPRSSPSWKAIGRIFEWKREIGESRTSGT